jgi:hypothetical protein
LFIRKKVAQNYHNLRRKGTISVDKLIEWQ